MTALLEVKDLVITAQTPRGPLVLVEGLSFTADESEITALIGESGCGKTMTALAVIGLLPPAVKVAGGSILLSGDRLDLMGEREWLRVRGRRVAMIFQEPMSSLNPLLTAGEQVAEVYRVHAGDGRGEAFKKAVEMLRRVHIPDPESRARQYPHQMSGGMRQRVMIAMALACSPDLLLADEPTTALDVTIQAQILELLQELSEEQKKAGRRTGILLITHDMGIVAQVARRIVVMYAGKEVECGDVHDVYRKPLHPYTRGLLKAIPSLTSAKLHPIPGQVPRPGERPPGCAFAPRCEFVEPACRQGVMLPAHRLGRSVRCRRSDLP